MQIDTSSQDSLLLTINNKKSISDDTLGRYRYEKYKMYKAPHHSTLSIYTSTQFNIPNINKNPPFKIYEISTIDRATRTSMESKLKNQLPRTN